MTAKKKSLNLRGTDRERWNKLKMKRMTVDEDPDLNDIEMLREMMDDYEEKLERIADSENGLTSRTMED